VVVVAVVVLLAGVLLVVVVLGAVVVDRRGSVVGEAVTSWRSPSGSSERSATKTPAATMTSTSDTPRLQRR